MANRIIRALRELTGLDNKFNDAFIKYIGQTFTKYDNNGKTYLEQGYNINPDVYSCISQMAAKTVAVPYTIKVVKDTKAYQQLNNLNISTKGLYSFTQSLQKNRLDTKAFSETEKAFPLESPNPTQTWADIYSLYKTYMRLNGNCYFYLMSPDDGINAGVPSQMYVLPAHLIKIVLKDDINLLSTDSPIKSYMLIQGDQFIEFNEDEVIHTKYANPNFDLQGSHLYGMSPIRAILRNINSQNSTIDNNVKTMQNGGVFGFIHGGSTGLTQPQADSLKQRLTEMDKSPDRLSQIAGASGEIAFTKISLNTDELKPFDYLKYDQKAICNALGWSDKLLNNNEGGGLNTGNLEEERKRVVTDNIQPDLVILKQAFDKKFIKRFKGYENAVIEWDISELPEMQTDMVAMASWLNTIPVTPNEIRIAMKYETLNQDGMDIVFMPSNKVRIDDVSNNLIDSAFNQNQ
ncbi:phage portal protein [Flavobacterium phage 11b]|uniref:phage portal protein n=1 Tax=Flavobacterium phage 11b TaxID=294631 RepID=UPI000044412E|nr:phage portal protein [Flavobacterium phage 11b]CAH56643.1 phage portal protein [Flavobacterium phage 11b]